MSELQFYLLAVFCLLLTLSLYGSLRARVDALKERLDSDSRFTAKGFDGIERRAGEDRRRLNDALSLDFRKPPP